jgi:AraC family transcriptional regulator
MEKINLHSNIESIIQYIEDNIERDLTLELLSEISCVSKFHLTRVFKSVADITIIDYVRSRKLARSVNDLLKTNLKVIDIAVKYAFNYEQTYIRAFKNEYCVTPSRFRKKPVPLKIVDKFNLAICMDFKSGILFRPQYIVIPEFKVIGIKDIIVARENYTKNMANNRGVEFFFNHSHKIKNAVNPNVYIGLTRLISNEADHSYYMPSLQVSSFDHLPDGMCCDTVPAGKYAVFHYIGNHPAKEISVFTMEALYDYIYQTWVPKNGYDFMEDGGFHFEEIDSETGSENYCEARIYFPLKL